MLRTKFAKNDYQVMKFCDEALKYRLFVPGWLLSEKLVNMRKEPDFNEHKIAICYNDGIPVGVVTLHNNQLSNKYYTWIFVKKSERRKGVGKLLIKCINKNVEYAIDGHFNGAPGSVKFFEKVGILETNF